MNTQQQALSQLSDHLHEEQAALSALLEVLQEETNALRDPLAQPLEAISQRKAALLHTLKGLETTREALFNTLNLQGNPKEVADHLRHHLGEPALACHWNSLLALVAECQQLNRLNGATIKLGQLRLQEALALLRGTPLDQSPYTCQGRSRPTQATRLLGQA